jgi:hypothetical protein
VAPNVSTARRLRARRAVCKQAGREREHHRTVIVRQRELESASIASTAADEGKPLHLHLNATEPRAELAAKDVDVIALALVGELVGPAPLVHPPFRSRRADTIRT